MSTLVLTAYEVSWEKSLGFWERPLSCNNDALLQSLPWERKHTRRDADSLTNDRFLHRVKVRLGGDVDEQKDQGGRNEITEASGGGRRSLQRYQSPCKNKMSNFTFRMESFSTDTLSAGLSLCLPTNSYKEFWAWRAFSTQEISEDTGSKSMEDGWGLNSRSFLRYLT